LPSFGISSLFWALRADPEPFVKLVSIFQRADLPPNYPAQETLTNGSDLLSIEKIAQHWREKGLTDTQISQRANHLAESLFPRWSSSAIKRVLYGLNSCGFLFPYKLGPSNNKVTRNTNMNGQWRFQLNSYLWLSWTNSADYQRYFIYFFRMPQPHVPESERSQQEMIEMLKSYVKSNANNFRDPFFLSTAP